MAKIVLSVEFKVEDRRERWVHTVRSSMVRMLPSVGEAVALEAPKLREHRGDDPVVQRLEVSGLTWAPDLETVTVHLVLAGQC
jgi:hypothetical protein